MSGVVVRDPLDSQAPGPGLDSSCGVQAWRAWVETQRSGGGHRKGQITCHWFLVQAQQALEKNNINISFFLGGGGGRERERQGEKEKKHGNFFLNIFFFIFPQVKQPFKKSFDFFPI